MIRLTSSTLKGSVVPPPSKSQAHRILIASYLAGQRLDILPPSEDIAATQRCLDTLDRTDSRTLLDGAHSLDCGESGSTLRFLIPLTLVLREGALFTGAGRLLARPLKPYFDLFDMAGGIRWKLGHEKDESPQWLRVEGTLHGGDYMMEGNVSSQFVTGLLFALPLVRENRVSTLCMTTPLESRGYVDMTLDLLQTCGIEIRESEHLFEIPGNQTYHPCTVPLEADWSQAAWWLAAWTLGHPVQVTGMNPDSLQGDRAILEYAQQMPTPGELEIDVSGVPDLVPPLAVMAALIPGKTTRIVGAGRLRWKESDRLRAISEVLSALGASVREGRSYLIIEGQRKLEGGVEVDAHNDHRIAMMTAIAATRCVNPVLLTGEDCVAKSYPTFWQEYRRLGGRLEKVRRRP